MRGGNRQGFGSVSEYDSAEDASIVGFHLDDGLISLDLCEFVATSHFIAFALQPLDNGAFGHVGTHRWHRDFVDQLLSPRSVGFR